MPLFCVNNNSNRRAVFVALTIVVSVLACGQLALLFAVSTETDNPEPYQSIDKDLLPQDRSNDSKSDDKSENNNAHESINTSTVHCVGDNFMADAWLYRSCQYQNLCWSAKLRDWVLFPSQHQQTIEEAWSHRFGKSKDHAQPNNGNTVARSSTTFQQQHLLQSTIGMRPWWRRQQPTPSFQWHPKVIWPTEIAASSSASISYFSEDDSVIVPISVADPPGGGASSMMTFLVDTLFPIHQLVEMFGFGSRHKVYLHVLNRQNQTLGGGSCGSDCWTQFLQGIRWMNYQLWEPAENVEKDSTTCFPLAVSGMGMLTASGLSQRGQKVQDYTQSFYHNAGRGTAFWKFRSHLLSKVEFPTKTVDVTDVILTPGTGLQAFAAAFTMLFEKNNGSNQNEISFEVLDDDIVGESEHLIRKASNARIWIANSHDERWTWPALFLRRDASVILLYNETQTIRTRKGKQAGPIRKDSGFWNHLSYVKTHWLSLQRNASELVDTIARITNSDTFTKTQSLVERYNQTQSVVTFSEFNVHKHVPMLNSPSTHCVGDNWQWDAPNYRSCKVKPLCFDTSSKQIVTLRAKEPPEVLRPFDFLATDPEKTVMRGENIRLGNGQPWSPNHTIIEKTNLYNLPDNVLMVPIKADRANMKNPGHILWDFWLPIFNLVQMFGERGILLLAFDDRKVQCSEVMDERSQICLGKLSMKLFPMIGAKIFGTSSAKLIATEGNVTFLESGIVCASTGLAGIGMLTDHGFKAHGQQLDDYKVIWNTGRGPFFWDFRRFILHNLGISSSTSTPSKVIFSINSSNNPSRRRDFSKHAELSERLLPHGAVQTLQLDSMSLQDQLIAVQDAKVFVSVVGGSASTAMFLERNACLILYYNDQDDFVRGSRRMPTMMDFDFWNNASYLQVHWLPISTMDSEKDLRLFSSMIMEHL